MQIILTRER